MRKLMKTRAVLQRHAGCGANMMDRGKEYSMFDRIDSKSPKRLRLWPIALLRVYTGIFFLWHGFGKLRGEDFVESLNNFLSARLETAFAFYKPFLEVVVIPNPDVFAALVAWGELLLGLALIVGFATRYAAFAGAFLAANFWFAKGQGLLEGSNHDVVWLVICLVLAIVPAGRVAGLDDGLADRMPFLR
jgi:thiosulfate dehydrogenase [quinone] large subunit